MSHYETINNLSARSPLRLKDSTNPKITKCINKNDGVMKGGGERGGESMSEGRGRRDKQRSDGEF